MNADSQNADPQSSSSELETDLALPAASPPGAAATPPKVTQQTWTVKLAVAGVAVVALIALFWPRGGVQFDAPNGVFYDSMTNRVELGQRLAPVTLLHFWATWCAPCITEVPSLNRLRREVESQQFAVIMVAVEDDVSKVDSFLGNHAATALYDPNWDVAHRFKTYKLPETYLLVGNTVVEKFVGGQDWDAERIRARLREKIREHLPEIGITVPAGSH